MKEKIKDILEKHYFGRNRIEEECADELLLLFSAVDTFYCYDETNRDTKKCNNQCEQCMLLDSEV